MYAEDSIELLRNCGINFERHQIEGIDTSWFAEMLITSGIVLMNRVNWITFHSGYDFCYLLKVYARLHFKLNKNEQFRFLQTQNCQKTKRTSLTYSTNTSPPYSTSST